MDALRARMAALPGFAFLFMSILSVVQARPLSAQEAITGRVRVFIDCNGTACDEDFFHQRVQFVDWVRDQDDANVVTIVTSQTTGAGGERYDLVFIGERAFRGLGDTLRYTSGPTDTKGEARDGLTRALEAGLLRYVARTPTLDQVGIRYREGTPVAVPEKDPWKHWVFTTSVSGAFSAQDRSSDYSVSLKQSVSRVTRGMKFGLDFSGTYDQSRYDLTDSTSVTSILQSYTGDALYVASLGSHWGAGIQSTVQHSTYSNYNLALRVAPAVEFNIFPYSESTRRQIRILYDVGLRHFDYTEETIFFKTAETRLDQSLSVTLNITELWGQAQFTLQGSNYLDNLSQNRLYAYNFLQFRLFKNFGMFVEASASRIRDQINLPRGGASEAEVLLQRKELLTGFKVSGQIGFNFTFGSLFNDIVNARFGG